MHPETERSVLYISYLIFNSIISAIVPEQYSIYV